MINASNMHQHSACAAKEKRCANTAVRNAKISSTGCICFAHLFRLQMPWGWPTSPFAYTLFYGRCNHHVGLMWVDSAIAPALKLLLIYTWHMSLHKWTTEYLRRRLAPASNRTISKWNPTNVIPPHRNHQTVFHSRVICWDAVLPSTCSLKVNF